MVLVIDKTTTPLWASITTIGLAHPDLLGRLEYDHVYNRTLGSTVVMDLFDIEGTQPTIEFASHLGITDVWDFSQHAFDPSRVDIPGLERFVSGLESSAESLREVETFKRMRDDGFEFIFRPIGRLGWERLELESDHADVQPVRRPPPFTGALDRLRRLGR
jgi:hypothetical protein